MLENEAKGWHGNYSVIGRNIVERFLLIKKKDEILSESMKKIRVKDFIFPDELKASDEKKKNKGGKDIDIFSENYEKLKKHKLKLKNEEKKLRQAELCTSKAKCDIKEKYKYHQYHHSDLNLYNDKLIKLIENKKKSLADYNPKMDVIWKKTLTGPEWRLLGGRAKKKNIKNSEKGAGFYLTHKTILSNAVIMEKQTQRGNLPLFNDLRIRTDKPFIPRNKIISSNSSINNSYNNSSNNIKINNTSNNNNNLITETINDNNIEKDNHLNFVNNKSIKTPNKSKNFNISENNKIEYLNTYSNFNSSKIKNLLDPDNNIGIKENKNNKINLKILNLTKKSDSNNPYFSPSKTNYKKKFIHTIDFSKALPRDTNFFLNKKELIDHPISNINYKLIEPRCVTMVSYSKKFKGKSIPKRFKGVDPHIFFDPDKVINKVNNHKEVTSPNFDIMTGRINDSGPLPSFMVKLFDRKSLDTMTEKGLKMNNYANVGFKTTYSSFQTKKSFNKSINYILLNNDKEMIDEELKKINKEIYGNKKWEKIVEEYTADQNKSKDYNGSNFDAITLKTIKRNRKEKIIHYRPLEYRF